MTRPLAAILVLFLAGNALADVVVMRDGSVRFGTVEAHDAQTVRFRLERDGISSVAMIPVPQISHIILGPAAPAPQPPIALSTASSMPATAPAPAGMVSTAPDPAPDRCCS